MNKKLTNYQQLVAKIRFSIELEAEFPEKVDIAKLRLRYRKLLNSWTVVTDGSMNNGLEFKPANKNKLYFNKESLAEISEILHIIRKHKGQTNGKKCGLHFHIDAKKLSSADIIKIVKEVMAKQDFIIKKFKVRPERLEQYCKRITKTDIQNLTPQELQLFRTNLHYASKVKLLQSKYYLLNLASLREHKTMEFRLFNGTKYLREIKSILTYLMNLLVYALERN